MKFDHPHSFDQAEACERIRLLTDYWAARHGIKATWHGSTATVSGKVKGVKFDGSFTVGPHTIKGEINVGFLAEKLGGRDYVEKKLQDYLSASHSLDALRARLSS